jgi:multidrug efflux pump subunit AcrA (membrane-fusion protein)
MSMDEAIPLEGSMRGRDAGASRKRVWLVFGLIVAIVIVGSTVTAYLIQRRPREGGNIAAASTISPEMREIDSTVTTSGTVRLRTGAEVRVGSQVSGIVGKLNVTVG